MLFLSLSLWFLFSFEFNEQHNHQFSMSFAPQIKYAGSDTDFSTSPAFCKQISKVEAEEQKVIGTQTPLQELLEGLIADKELPAKDKRKRLKQVCSYYFWNREDVLDPVGGVSFKSWWALWRKIANCRLICEMANKENFKKATQRMLRTNSLKATAHQTKVVMSSNLLFSLNSTS